MAKATKPAEPAEAKVDEEREPDRVAMLSIQADGTPVPGQVLIEE